ncbi:MAG: hypothetical protein JRN39_05290 [Nitrososphaerota archaeon]|nr:hypothetical protein [Nitrososphaerota archaeon]MDG6939800.1 hypothetical protein [Nitrososphaerota archaeon]
MPLTTETILAEEQAVRNRGVGVRTAVESAFGEGGTEGTLVLTDRRLLYVCSSEQEEDIPTVSAPFGLPAHLRLKFSDVSDLDGIAPDPTNVMILLSSVTRVAGHRGEISSPKLEVSWKEGGEEKRTEFVQQVTGGRKKNLDDWAAVIERLLSGSQKVVPLPSLPRPDTLEGKVIRVLADMQEKGIFEIESETEAQFKVELDPDDVQAACEKLVSEGLLTRRPGMEGDPFYSKASPLGGDDLSP